MHNDTAASARGSWKHIDMTEYYYKDERAIIG